MKAIIVEDETAAARNLHKMLHDTASDIEVLAVLESIADCVKWFGCNPAPDVVFMDIHLADGDSFRVFDLVDIQCPIIFTTAYDQYALKAFSVNSIDYLLKPIEQSQLERALTKLHKLTPVERQEMQRNINKIVESECPSVLLVQVKDRIIPLKVADIAYFYTADDKVRAYTQGGEVYVIGKTLDKLSNMLSTSDFYRANRQFIISRSSIRDVSVWFGSRVAINVLPEAPERIVVSKERSGEFKRWLAGS